MEDTLNPRQIYGILRKKVMLIVSLVILGAVIAGVWSFYVMTPMYQASTQILVHQEQKESSVLDNQSIETDLQLINTYSVIVESPLVLNQVIQELNLKMTFNELAAKVSTETIENIQVMYIYVENENPETAVMITNKVADVLLERIPELMSVDNLTVLSQAVPGESETPISPNPYLIITIASIAGLMLGIGLAFVLTYMDTTLKDEEDVKNLLDIPVLGMIAPMVEKEKGNDKVMMTLKRREV